MFRFLGQLFSPKHVSRDARSVLIIDPQASDTDIVTRALRSRGFRVILARQGAEGFYTTCQKRPDLVIMECVLPDTDGLDVCRFIRNNQGTKDIPVLFLTSVEDGYLILQCFGAGGDGFLNKPVNASDLLSEVDFILRRNRSYSRG